MCKLVFIFKGKRNKAIIYNSNKIPSLRKKVSLKKIDYVYGPDRLANSLILYPDHRP